MVGLVVYVEGGGNGKALRTACRAGFSQFLEKAGLKGRLPRIVASGGRRQAYDDFCIALKQGKHAAMLLVDSEGPVATASAWDHLKQRQGDGWNRPPNATDDQCHLMVQCMESWLLADREALTAFFGQGYNAGALPAECGSLEAIEKDVLHRALADATRHCKTKAPYGKGEHSFLLLAKIDRIKVTIKSSAAAGFIAAVEKAHPMTP